MTTLYTANPRSAYRAGHFTGNHRVADVLDHGDHGLGACDLNDGELVVLDGVAYRTTRDGSTAEAAADLTTPYATVMPFQAERSFELGPMDQDGVEAAIGALVPLANRIWAVRISGTFEVVTAGAGEAQHPPFRPMSEVIPEYRWIEHRETTGTLVGFSCPSYLLGVDKIGFHHHWLSDDRTQGGHVIGYTTRTVQVEVAEATTSTLDVAPDAGLLALDLTPSD